MADRSSSAERLLLVAEELVAREGVEKLTLRRVARRAGVSHGAPLRHFASLSELAAEVAARGFQRLEEACEKGAASLPAGADPRERLAAAGRAYVEMAVETPGLFALMFRPELLDRENPRYVRHASAAFEQVVRSVRAAQGAGFQPATETRALAGAVWSAVHGLASLWSQGALEHPTGASLETSVDVLLSLILAPQPGETP